MLSFSVNYTSEIPEDVDRGWFYFFVTLLNQFYWVASATIGGIIGSLLKFDTSGISFVMTAMFVVIFLDQWMKEKIHVSSIIGILVSLVCLILFGADSFMIPTMILIVLLLTVLRKWLEQCDKLKENKKTPEYIQYLGKFLPSAVFGMLVIYCLKNVFLSIAGGTICYMLILYFL